VSASPDDPQLQEGVASPAPIPLDRLKDPSFWLSSTPTSAALTGSSMEPFLRDGDVIEVVRASKDDLFPGQLLVFLRNGEVVTHRLLASRPDRFLEKGDAQSLGNWQLWPEAIGVVVAVTREGERERVQLDQSPWPEALRRAAARHLKVHRVHRWANMLPGSLSKRGFLKLARLLG
jgi:hypothetical protein